MQLGLALAGGIVLARAVCEQCHHVLRKNEAQCTQQRPNSHGAKLPRCAALWVQGSSLSYLEEGAEAIHPSQLDQLTCGRDKDQLAMQLCELLVI